MTTPQDRLTIEGMRQTIAAQDATIATLRAEIEAEHNALGRLGIATLEIAALRAALDDIAKWTTVADTNKTVLVTEFGAIHDRALAALAAAKETGG